MKVLSFITSNDHKYQEMRNKLQGTVDLNHINLNYPEMQADRIKDIARSSLATMIPLIDGDFLLEDSGISVNALNGFPGPYSSYVFRTIGWQGILELMKPHQFERSATFKSVIALYHDSQVVLFEGRCQGSIGFEGRGDKGFGFDPIFIPSGQQHTLAELPLHEKNKLSHRGKSTQKLKIYLENR